MGTPHVCFADMPQYEQQKQKQKQPYSGCNSKTDKRSKVNAMNAADGMNEKTDDAATMTQLSHGHSGKESNSSPNSVSPIPRYERNLGFFRQLSRRFGLRSSVDPVYSNTEDDAHSSSTDSCSSATGTMMPPTMQSSATSMSSSSTAGTAAAASASVMIKNGCTASMEQISCASSETSSTMDIDEKQQQQQQQKSIESAAARERKSVTRSSFSRLQRRSTSSIRRAFESFSLSSRSLSCSGATPPLQRESSTTGNGGRHTNNNNSNGSTPIKSALKSTSNMELNKRPSTSSSSSSCNFMGNASHNHNSKSTKTKSKPPPQRILRQPVSYTYLKGISGLPTQRVPRNSVCCQYARR